MARVYTTGTISQPDAGSVGLAMVERIRDDIVAHAAWDLQEEFTAASGLVRWYVFKCLASASGLPNDFYLVIGRTLSSGKLDFAICESYTNAGHMMQFYAPIGTGASARAYDASGRYAGTYSLATTAFPTSSNSPFYRDWTPAGTSTKWWLIVDNDGIVVAFNGAANGFVYAGAFTPLSDLAWPMPLLIAGSTGVGSVSDIGLTRNPAIASAAGGFFGALICEGVGGATLSSNQILGFRGDPRYNDKLQTNQRAVAELGLTISSVAGQVDYITSTGFVVGKAKGVRGLGTNGTPPGFAFGDAYALDGRLWVPYLPTDLRIWDTGVAAA